MTAYLKLGSRLLILSILVRMAIINHPVKAQSPRLASQEHFANL